jgi:signal peptidase II
MSRAWPYFLASLAIVLADQITKWIVLARFAPLERLEITPFFNLVLAFNKGAAFSFLAGAGGWQTPLLVAFALVAAIVVSVLLLRSPGRRLFCAGLALILGGAVGNVIDRLRFGWHWPAFNVADSAITVGAALLILDGFRHHERRAGASS